MGKGKIIIVTDNEKGKLMNENGKEIEFCQPLLKELGLKEGSSVRFDVYTDPISKVKTAFNVEKFRKGIIVIKENEKTPTIVDDNHGVISLLVPLLKEQGITDGATVRYDHAIGEDGAIVGVYVKLAQPD